MSKRLPARPNLEHLRSQAKVLLSELRSGSAEAAKAFERYLPEAAKGGGGRRDFRLADAQAVVARKTGFAEWPALARHVDRLRSLEGTWAFRALEVDGRAMPAAMLGASQLLIDGDRFRMESPEATYEGIFTIDVEAAPQRIDIDFHEGPEAGNRCEGIFELEGDRFRLCLGLAGARRPAGFRTSAGSGHALEELERVERARPAGVDGGTRAEGRVALGEGVETGGFEEASGALIDRLQGEWAPVELNMAGTAMKPMTLAFGFRVHEGNEARVVFGGQTMLHVKMRFNEAAQPVEVDYLNLAGPAAGQMARGLFRWDGEEAVFCMAAAGAPRPAEFGCEAGSGRTYSRWRRK